MTTTTTAADSKVDAWVQRLSLAAMVAVALGLLGVGVVLYAPGAQAARERAPEALEAGPRAAAGR